MFKQVNKKYKDFIDAGHLMDLDSFISLPETARKRTKELAVVLVKDITVADEKLTQFKLRSELPITQADKKEIEFFESNVLPNRFKLDQIASENPELFLKIEKLLSGMDFSDSNGKQKSTDIYKFILLRIIDELLHHEPEDGGELMSLYVDDIDFESLKSIRLCVQSKYFDPQGWVERGRQANLLFSKQDPLKYPMRIRDRISEAYNAYISGYNYACIATCRSLLEYVLVDRAKSNTKWKFDPYYLNSKGEQEIKSLSTLCDKFSDISTGLDYKLNFIRLNGNRVLHTPSNGKKEEFPPQNKTAQECLKYVYEVIEELYC